MKKVPTKIDPKRFLNFLEAKAKKGGRYEYNDNQTCPIAQFGR